MVRKTFDTQKNVVKINKTDVRRHKYQKKLKINEMLQTKKRVREGSYVEKRHSAKNQTGRIYFDHICVKTKILP